MSTQAKSDPRKEFCDVLYNMGYGTDLIEGLGQAGDIAAAIAYLKIEE